MYGERRPRTGYAANGIRHGYRINRAALARRSWRRRISAGIRAVDRNSVYVPLISQRTRTGRCHAERCALSDCDCVVAGLRDNQWRQRFSAFKTGRAACHIEQSEDYSQDTEHTKDSSVKTERQSAPSRFTYVSHGENLLISIYRGRDQVLARWPLGPANSLIVVSGSTFADLYGSICWRGKAMISRRDPYRSPRENGRGLERAEPTVRREVARQGGHPEYRAKEEDQPGNRPGGPSGAC